MNQSHYMKHTGENLVSIKAQLNEGGNHVNQSQHREHKCEGLVNQSQRREHTGEGLMNQPKQREHTGEGSEPVTAQGIYS